MSSKHTNADAVISSLAEKVTEAIFSDIGLPDAPWVDEWKARAPKAAIAVVIRDQLTWDKPVTGLVSFIVDYARKNGIEL